MGLFHTKVFYAMSVYIDDLCDKYDANDPIFLSWSPTEVIDVQFEPNIGSAAPFECVARTEREEHAI